MALNSIFKGVVGLAKSGSAGRAVLGGVAGGITGALQGYNNPNQRGESIAKGILLGAIGGGAISRAHKIAYAGVKTVAKGSVFSPTPLGRLGGFAKISLSGLGGSAKKAIKFAARNPLETAVGVAGIYGAAQLSYGSMGTSPTMNGVKVNTNYNQQAIAMDQMTMGGSAGLGSIGTAPQMMNRYHRAFQQSTDGLTLGLNRGRHG